MSLLKNLKVVANPAGLPKSAEQFRRNKLIGKLQEQMSLAEAELGGKPYKRMRSVIAPNAEGEPVRIQRPVRLKQWWSKNASGNIILTVRYGAKSLVISNGMSAIEVGMLEDLPGVIGTVIKAVDVGEFDAELASVAKGRGFVKRPKISLKK